MGILDHRIETIGSTERREQRFRLLQSIESQRISPVTSLEVPISTANFSNRRAFGQRFSGSPFRKASNANLLLILQIPRFRAPYLIHHAHPRALREPNLRFDFTNNVERTST